MGVYLRNAMPLLSTLAALVIIVHSAEEDLQEYRRDLRPRAADVDTTNYEPPWRAVRIEPMMTQSTQTDTWDGSPEKQQKHRRPLRKRRRRPRPFSTEIFPPQEEYSGQRVYRPDNEGSYRPLTETPQRRRKKNEPKPKTWNNEPVNKGRPSRRKEMRRKTPEQEPWHELSEFGDIPSDEYLELNEANQKQEVINYEPDFDSNASQEEPRLTLKQFYKAEKNRNPDATGDDIEIENEDYPSQFPINKDTEYEEEVMPQIKEDKSLSEFSLETENFARISKNKSEEVMPFKGTLSDIKEHKPLDASSLKEILKKSNGKSLSELLQQHNLTLADLLNGDKKVLSAFKSTDMLQNNKENTEEQETTARILTTELRKAMSNNKPKVFDEDIEEAFNNSNKYYELTSSELPPSSTELPPSSSELPPSSSELPLSTTISHFIKQSSNTPAVRPNASLNTVDKYKLNINVSSNNNYTTESYTRSHKTGKMEQNETNTSFLRRRLPVGVSVRMKLRMRPLSNNSYKGQLSRDLIALTSKRYHNNRNNTKIRDWKEYIPVMINKTQTKQEDKQDIRSKEEDVDNLKTTDVVKDTTTIQPIALTNVYTTTEFENETQTDISNTKLVSTTTISPFEETSELIVTTTLKPIVSPRPRLNITSLRHQAFANRLRRKKLKQKLVTNETAQDHTLKDIFNMANLVSASEFIAKIHTKPTTLSDETESVTMLEDFMSTETTTKASTQTSTTRSRATAKAKSTTTVPPKSQASTTEIAKIEIEEILDDDSARDRLSKILKERNMTLTELVEHRERGSSHVHLADIFHNASKEPNPPEPFLSKSLIEPISKETYPLRALLEANSHDPTVKPTTVEPYLFAPHYINIPIAMDFGNNVNENGENHGIVSLFNNFTKPTEPIRTNEVDNTNKSIEATNSDSADKTTRQSRVISHEQDLVTLNEIFSLMRKSRNISDEHSTLTSELNSPNISVGNTMVEDIDGDGLIALEDLQNIKKLKEDTSFLNDKVEHNLLESLDTTPTISNPTTIHSNTRSVTLVTASIVGLIAVLFLLTYAAFKWKHQQQIFRRKQCSTEEQIPTPVFENRKSNKNSSFRSMSPMLSSNIYSVNTLEKSNNNECPEYMWDSLRKPFQ